MADTNSTDQSLQENLGAFQQKLTDFHTQGEDYVRANPTPSFLSALGVGFVLQLLPIGTLVSALVRLAFFALRPAIFIYGAVTLYKQFQQNREQSHE